MSFPPLITGLKLRVSTGTSPNVQTFEQPIHPSELSGTTNSVLVTNSDLLNAFNSQPLGTTFTPSIVTTYEGFPSSNSISSESSSPYVPPAVISLATTIPSLNTLSAPFSLNISTNNPAPLFFSSNNTSVVTVSSSGLVTVQGVGMATITITQPALGGSVYAAAVPVSTQLVVKAVPNLSLASITNKLTTSSPFSLSVSSLSDGALTYSSSAAGVATVNSMGLVTLVGAGTTTITVSQAASLDGVYAAASVSQQLVVSVAAAPTIQRGFSVLTDNSDFAGLDFDSDMTTLFTNMDESISGITMPNSNFMFNGAAYAILYASSNGWFSFGTNVSEVSFGTNNQLPINTFRFFGQDHESTGSYKFVSNDTRLLIKLTGYIYGDTTKTFTIKVIIEQSGEIRTNYTLASTFTSNQIIIGYVGNNSSATSDDIFLTLGGVTFKGDTMLNLFVLLNGKTILYKPPNSSTFGSFTLPTDIQVYQNQTITRVLTPPTSNSSGAFTFTSSNTAVATISISGGVSSINVIGGGTTIITATQAASGGYDSSSVTASLTVTVVLPTFGTFTLPSDIQVYQNQTITRVLTPPTSNSSGGFTFSSSNTAVATISVNNGVSSINVIGPGTTTIIAVQALSGIYASRSTPVSLTVTILLPTFGTFTLPSSELVYQNQTITRVLTPPTSNSLGAFTFESSNTAVATITVNNGVSSINVIGAGTVWITAIQAASGDYASSLIPVFLDTATGISDYSPIESIINVRASATDPKMLRVFFSVANDRNPIGNTSIYIVTNSGSGYSTPTVVQGETANTFYATINTFITVNNTLNNRINLIRVNSANNSITYSEKTNVYLGANF
jgi:hypothetical protein